MYANAKDDEIVPNKELSLNFFTFKELAASGEGYFFFVPFCENLTVLIIS